MVPRLRREPPRSSIAPTGRPRPSTLVKNEECPDSIWAGCLRVSLRYRFLPPSCQEGGQGDSRKGFSSAC